MAYDRKTTLRVIWKLALYGLIFPIILCIAYYVFAAGGHLVQTYAAATTRISYVDGNAHFSIVGQNLSTYADPHYRFEIEDAEGDILYGVGLATGAGASETVGSELVTDPVFEDVTETNIYTSDFSVDEDGFTSTRATVVGNIDGIDGKDDNLRITVNTDDASHFGQQALYTIGKAYRTRFSYDIPSTNSHVDGIAVYFGTVSSVNYTTVDAWTDVDVYNNVTSTFLSFCASDGAYLVFQDAGGDDVFYIANGIPIDEVTFDSWTAEHGGPGASSGSLTNKFSIDGSQIASKKLYQDASTSEGALYKAGGTISDYTAGNGAPLVGGTSGTNCTGDGAITAQYIVAGADAEDGAIFDSDADMSWDDHTLKQVTDPPNTGVRIIDAKGSATRNWTSKDAGFDFNESTYTVRVYRLDPVMIIQ